MTNNPRQLPVEAAPLDQHQGREVRIADLIYGKVYILAQVNAASFNFSGIVYFGRSAAYRFSGPRADLGVFLRERPDNSGMLEDGRGVKVTVYEYIGEDA